MDEAEQSPKAPSRQKGDGGRDRRNWTNGAPFGCLTAFLFACIAGFVVFMGTIMGDCAPGSHCHAHDDALLLRGLGFVGAAALALGFCVRTGVNLAWVRLTREAGPQGAGCVATAAAVLIGILAGAYWIYAMIALGA